MPELFLYQTNYLTGSVGAICPHNYRNETPSTLILKVIIIRLIMWYFKYTDLSNRDSVTLQIRNSYKNAERIIVDSLPVDPKGKVIRSLHHCFDGMENLKEVIFKDSVDLKNIDDTRCMFNNCQKLERVVFPTNAFPYIFDCSYMFQSCPMLKEIVAPNLFVSPYTNRLSDSLHMFSGILNDTPVDGYNVPRSINLLVELDAIKRGSN